MAGRAQPAPLTVHLEHIGSASSYRAVDFRKPVLRNIIRGKLNGHFQDLPVFNGKYCHHLLPRRNPARARRHVAPDGSRRAGVLRGELAAIFMHRPYHRMPEQSLP